MTELFAYAFMQRAFLAGVLIALTAGLLGTFMVQRRLSFLGDGLAHAAFGGMGIGAFVIVTSGLLASGGALLRNPMWIALPISLLVGLAIAYVKQRTDLSSDTTFPRKWNSPLIGWPHKALARTCAAFATPDIFRP